MTSDARAASRDRLAVEPNLWVCTVRADSRPHLTPVWFVFVDECFWIGIGASSVKSRNIAVNPSVTVSLEDGNHPVVAEGTASTVDRPYPANVTLAFADKYDWDITQEIDPDMGRLSLVRIDVARWTMGRPDPAAPAPHR